MLDKRKFYIDGEWVDPIRKNDFDVINPCNEDPCAVISLGSTEDTNRAVKAAKTAFETWKETSKEERIKLLEKLLTIYKKRFNEMAEAISLEMGAPMDWSTNVQTASGRDHLEDFILRLKNFNFEEHFDEKSNNHICYEPIGVCGLITPWNWPINQVVSKLAPCLASGCTAVLKPSEIAPLSSMVIAEIFHEAGVPKGVFNLVNGLGPVVGEAMSNHVGIDMMSFTGSTRGGIAVARASANSVKRVCQELGGKSANIILDDADFGKAVTKGTAHMFNNTGQSCNAPSRMLVPASRQDEAKEAAKAVAEGIVIGDPSDESTNMGPVVSDVQFNKIQGLIEKGIEEGAEVVVGGPGKPEGLNQGYFVKPTVFANVSNDMTIAREEIFGPVLCIIPYKDEDDAIRIANDTPYGLSGYVSSEDPEHALSVARRIRSGNVHINNKPTGIDAPFGGFKQSGNGREWGEFGFEEFLEIKAVMGYASK